MKVCQLVPVAHICIGWPTQNISQNVSIEDDKWSLIESSVKFLTDRAGLSREICETAIQLVNDREKSMTTAIGHGIAIPHASIPGISQPLGALIVITKGIDFEAIDHEPVKIIALVLLPDKDYKKHIQTLSSIVDLTSHPDIMHHILEATTPQEIWNSIARLESDT